MPNTACDHTFENVLTRGKELNGSKMNGHSLFMKLCWSSKTHKEKTDEAADLVQNMSLDGDMMSKMVYTKRGSAYFSQNAIWNTLEEEDKQVYSRVARIIEESSLDVPEKKETPSLIVFEIDSEMCNGILKKSVGIEIKRMEKMVKMSLLKKNSSSDFEKIFFMPHKQQRGSRVALMLKISYATWYFCFEKKLVDHQLYSSKNTFYYAIIDPQIVELLFGQCSKQMNDGWTDQIGLRVQMRSGGRRFGFVTTLDEKKQVAVVKMRGNSSIKELDVSEKGQYEINPLLIKYSVTSGQMTVLFHRLCTDTNGKVNATFSS